MKKNIGKRDRIARLVVSLFLIGVAFVFESKAVALAFLLAGFFTLFETLSGWCAFYSLVGKNTCPVEMISSKK